MNVAHYDAIIIGSGAGGSAAVYALARAGQRVLLLEKGRELPRDGSTLDVDQVAEGVLEDARVMLVPEVVTIQSLADVLNEMGGTPQDLISILQALRRLGAIQVEIETL